jgi:hypothetical protein
MALPRIRAWMSWVPGRQRIRNHVEQLNSADVEVEQIYKETVFSP